MKRWAILASLAASFAVSGSAFAQTYVDVVHLHNGSAIRGTIVEQVPGESLKIQTPDGSVFVCAIDDVAKMVKEFVEVEVEAEEDARPTGPKKNPGSALAWSVLLGGFTPLDGGGQFYNGESGKGVLFLTAGLVGFLTMVNGLEEEDDGTVLAGAVVRLTSHIGSSIDAYGSAKRMNHENGWTTATEPPASSVYLGMTPDGKGRGGMLAFTRRMYLATSRASRRGFTARLGGPPFTVLKHSDGQ